jgi:hypothetical protein
MNQIIVILEILFFDELGAIKEMIEAWDRCNATPGEASRMKNYCLQAKWRYNDCHSRGKKGDSG